ncbi:MAG: hypothetical protein ACOYOD_14925 [Saprospiraceae bacterium]|jgi:hypothetical protein
MKSKSKKNDLQPLKELVTFAEYHKIEPQVWLPGTKSTGAGKGDKIWELYQLVLTGEVETNQQAASLLFNAEFSKGHYRKSKNKLKSLLIDSIFTLDPRLSLHTEYDRALSSAWKGVVSTKLLFGYGIAMAAAEYGTVILRDAEYYEFTEMSLCICRSLRSCYATRYPMHNKLRSVNRRIQLLEELYNIENQAEALYYELVQHRSKRRINQPDLATLASDFHTRLEPHARQVNSWRFIKFFYQIKVASVLLRYEYSDTLSVCDEALRVLGAKPFFSPELAQFFLAQKMVCHLQLNQFEEGRVLAAEYNKYEEIGSYNWYHIQGLLMRLALHTGNYQEAYSTFRNAVGKPGFKGLDPVFMEVWMLFEAYLRYLEHLGRISMPDMPANPHFRLFRFINDVPGFSRDKRGMNIPILVLQIIFTIAQKRYEIAAIRIDAIGRYAMRHLREGDTLRSNIFIRMLQTLKDAGFNQLAAERRARKWIEKLSRYPKQYSNYEIEIIPYEPLWKLIVSSLDPKVHYQPNYIKAGYKRDAHPD